MGLAVLREGSVTSSLPEEMQRPLEQELTLRDSVKAREAHFIRIYLILE